VPLGPRRRAPSALLWVPAAPRRDALCTGTKGRAPQGYTDAAWDTKTVATCSQGPGPRYGKYHYTVSTELDEQETPEGSDWAFPMITVRDAWTTITAGKDPCDGRGATYVNSFDVDVANEIKPV